MKSEEVNRFKDQIIKVIQMLELQYTQNPTNILELILSRYRSSLKNLEQNRINNLKKSDFCIKGSVRAYLDSSSDYNNPVLEEMYIAEKLFENIFD